MLIVLISEKSMVLEVMSGIQYFLMSMQRSVMRTYLSSYKVLRLSVIPILNLYSNMRDVRQLIKKDCKVEFRKAHLIKPESAYSNKYYNRFYSFFDNYIDKYNKFQMRQLRKLENDLFSVNSRSLDNREDHSPYSTNSAGKMSTGSLSKYTKSPYLQKFSQGFTLPKKLIQHSNNTSHGDKQKIRELENMQGDGKNMRRQQLEAINKKVEGMGLDERNQSPRSKSNLTMINENKEKTLKFKLPKLDMENIRTDKKQKFANNSISATLEVTSKKKKLMPILQFYRSQVAIKTKAGTNGTQTKINQDIAIVQTALPHGVRLYCVCDGHGLNGHLVSTFIKQNLIKNLTVTLKKQVNQPTKIQLIFEQCLARTNDALLNSDINTQLSGSTVIAVFIHKETIYSFNIGDSRAILVTQKSNDTHQAIALSDDQKPSRQDEKERIIKFGGRIEAQKNQRGQILGPLRVWMKDIQMPGLAMTRSFGDKAGIKAGTNGQPQLIKHEIRPEDKFVVIASDGIWQYLQNDEVMNIILPFYKKNDIDLAAQKVMKIAIQIWQKISYSRDDITVIIVSLNPPQTESKQEKGFSSLKYTEVQQ